MQYFSFDLDIKKESKNEKGDLMEESRISFEQLKASAKNDLIAAGLDEKQSEIVADCFATADIYGVNSHGCAILPAHIQRITRGGYNCVPNCRVIRQTASFAVVDGDNAIGPVSAMFCLDLAVQKAKDVGVYSVFAKNNNTFGPAFYYSLKAAERGCIAFVCSNSPAQMAPIGGKEKMLGTNPLAMVIPVPDDDPIIVDMATSVVAKSKFKEYKAQGKPLPEGWAMDQDGKPTTDPDEGIQGLVLPMAGYKGYALSMLLDIVSGVLSGAAYLNKVGRFYSEDNGSMNVGFYMSVIDPQIVCGEAYHQAIADFAGLLKHSAAAEGCQIVLPGADRVKYKAEHSMATTEM